MQKKVKRRALTPREIEVLRLASHGLTYVEIAERLGISPRTVEDRIARAKKQLDASNVTHACAIALRGKLFR